MGSVIEGVYLYRVRDGGGTDMFISLVLGKGLFLVSPEVKKYISLLEKLIFKLDLKMYLLFTLSCMNNIMQIVLEIHNVLIVIFRKRDERK